MNAFERNIRPDCTDELTAALRQRIVSGENGNMNGIPFALRSGLPLRTKI